MKRLILLVMVVLAVVFVSTPRAQTPAVALTLDGFFDLQPNGGDTSYMSALTAKKVGGELLFLSATHTGHILSFTTTGRTFGDTITTPTHDWNASALFSEWKGIYFDEVSQKLFISGSHDYTGDYAQAWVTTVTLNDDNTISNIHKIYLSNVNEKRMFGSCRRLPDAWQTFFGGNKFLCGFGGYTSMVTGAGGAAMGPTLFAIPDPATVAEGASVVAKFVLNTDVDHRGIRKTIPLNYFDGGACCGVGAPNGAGVIRPTLPPDPSGLWLSPNSDGNGWFMWGDTYLETGEIIGDNLHMIASVGIGAGWYADSDLRYDDRGSESHVWKLSRLTGTDVLTRPDSMTVLTLPKGHNPCNWYCNVSGTYYDAVAGKLWAVVYPGGMDGQHGRLYRLSVSINGAPDTPPSPPPPPVNPPVNCVGSWSVPVTSVGACVNGQHTVTSTSTFHITTPAAYGGSLCSSAEGQINQTTVVQACSIPTSCASPVLRFRVTTWPSNVGRTNGAWNIEGQVGAWSVTFGGGRNPRTATAQDSRGAQCAITLTKF